MTKKANANTNTHFNIVTNLRGGGSDTDKNSDDERKIEGPCIGLDLGTT